MPSLYKCTGYNLDRMELTWMWLDAQVEQMNEEAKQKDLIAINPDPKYKKLKD